MKTGRWLGWAALFLALMAFLVWGIIGFSGRTEEERIEAVRKAVVRACVNCYASEGAYPESVDYMKENYGLTVDESRYIVVYEVFSSNVLPTIQILEAGG